MKRKFWVVALLIITCISLSGCDVCDSIGKYNDFKEKVEKYEEILGVESPGDLQEKLGANSTEEAREKMQSLLKQRENLEDMLG